MRETKTWKGAKSETNKQNYERNRRESSDVKYPSVAETGAGTVDAAACEGKEERVLLIRKQKLLRHEARFPPTTADDLGTLVKGTEVRTEISQRESGENAMREEKCRGI